MVLIQNWPYYNRKLGKIYKLGILKMDALTLLLERRSWSKLIEPAPKGDQLNNILSAGMRAPDHGGLKPWHFTLIEGEGRNKLGNIFQQALITEQAPESKIDKAKNAPLRAPLIIMVTTCLVEHEKVPEIEQVMAAGCVVQAMQMAAVAQGFQGIWRTGDFAYNGLIKDALSVKPKDYIVGYLYLGTAEHLPEKFKTVNFENLVSKL